MTAAGEGVLEAWSRRGDPHPGDGLQVAREEVAEQGGGSVEVGDVPDAQDGGRQGGGADKGGNLHRRKL